MTRKHGDRHNTWRTCTKTKKTKTKRERRRERNTKMSIHADDLKQKKEGGKKIQIWDFRMRFEVLIRLATLRRQKQIKSLITFAKCLFLFLPPVWILILTYRTIILNFQIYYSHFFGSIWVKYLVSFPVSSNLVLNILI